MPCNEQRYQAITWMFDAQILREAQGIALFIEKRSYLEGPQRESTRGNRQAADVTVPDVDESKTQSLQSTVEVPN